MTDTGKDHSFYMEGSSGKGVLLVHGLTGAPAEMRFVGKRLHRMGFTVYAPTLAGHCKDEASLLATCYEDWLESLREALLRFSTHASEIHTAGICVGGGLGLYLACQEPALVKSVVIYSATLNYDGWNTPFYYALAPYGIPVIARIPGLKRIGFAESPPYGMKCDRTRKAIMEAIVNDGCGIEGTLPRFPVRALHQNYRLNKALAEILPRAKTPTLLIHAKQDDVSHPRNADKIRKLHGGICELAWLENSYHMIHIDQERHKVAELTAEFFEKASSAYRVGSELPYP